MDKTLEKRIHAIKMADATNAIEGVPVPQYARRITALWAKGEISQEEMYSQTLAALKEDIKHGQWAQS